MLQAFRRRKVPFERDLIKDPRNQGLGVQGFRGLGLRGLGGLGDFTDEHGWT